MMIILDGIKREIGVHNWKDYLTVKFGIKTYESYLEWCREAKEQIKEWEK